MSAKLTPKQRVKARYPKAHCSEQVITGCARYTVGTHYSSACGWDADQPGFRFLAVAKASASDAWRNAWDAIVREDGAISVRARQG